MKRDIPFRGLLDEEDINTLTKLEDLMRKKGWTCFLVDMHSDGTFSVGITDGYLLLEGDSDQHNESTLAQATIEAMEDIIYQEAELAEIPDKEDR